MVVPQKRFQCFAVSRGAIRPEILAHQGMRFDQPFDKGQRDFGGRRVAQLSERYLFCFFEGLEHRTWQPTGMPIGERASKNADEMHDGNIRVRLK